MTRRRPAMKHLLEEFKRNRDERPDAPAFLVAAGDRSVSISWRTFARDIEAIAWLADRHLPGATVGLLGENSYEWMTAHVAGLFSGLTLVPFETNLSASEIAERLVFTGAVALIHSAQYAEKAQAVHQLLPTLWIGGFGSRKADELMARAYAALDEGAPSVFEAPPRDEDETAMLVFTSGTTSRPRGAELTMRGIRTFAAFASSQLPMKAGDRSLMLLPLNHIFGICTTYMMLAKGVTLGVCSDFRRIYDATERFRARFLFLVPAVAEILAAKIAQRGNSAEAVLGTPLDWILVGGAPLARRTYEQMMSLGIRPLGGYGLTETTSLYSIAPFDDPRPGSAGLSCHGFGGMETRVRADGLLQIRGPSVLKGYFKEPARTADVLDADGWFNTGDIGRIDEAGYVWITGRASRTIVLSSGKKVAPEELEEKLLSIPGILEVVVSGNGATRELKAEVYTVVSEETVRRQIDFVNRQMPVHKRIKTIVVRTEPFPRTSSGKIKVTPETPSQPEPAVSRAARPSVATPAGHSAGFSARMTETFSQRRMKRVLGAAAILLMSVVGLNVLEMIVMRTHGTWPPGIHHLMRWIDEGGDLLLGLLLLVVVLMIRQANGVRTERSRRKGS